MPPLLEIHPRGGFSTLPALLQGLQALRRNGLAEVPREPAGNRVPDGQLGKGAMRDSTLEVKKEPIADSAWAVPTGYKKVDSPAAKMTKK